MSNKRRKGDNNSLRVDINTDRGTDATTNDSDHPLITKLEGLIDKIRNQYRDQRGEVPRRMQYYWDDDLNQVVRSCERFLENSVNAAGEWLHNLPGPDQPDISVVKEVIDSFPDAIFHRNDMGYIPIQSISQKARGVKYIPILAEEASKREIGLLEKGGLLLPSPYDEFKNVLQSLLFTGFPSPVENTEYEDMCIHAMESLRNLDLLVDKDFARFNLLHLASFEHTAKRLEYLINVYPVSFSTPLYDGDYPIHMPNIFQYIRSKEDDICFFTTLLKCGMKYYPTKFGFLFKKNRQSGRRPINKAIRRLGKRRTLQIIRKLIPPSENHPILHYVYRHTPSLVNDFVYMYPNAVRLKDGQGRHLFHIAFRRGLKISPSLLMMIHCDKKCLEVKDPVTNLYPFMLAATSGFPKDLTTIYNLLCYCPEVLFGC